MSRDLQDAEEHFREFDADILQSAMDVLVCLQLLRLKVSCSPMLTCTRQITSLAIVGQADEQAMHELPAVDMVEHRHEHAPVDHHYNPERPAAHGQVPLGEMSHGSVVPVVHRRRGSSHSMACSNILSRHVPDTTDEVTAVTMADDRAWKEQVQAARDTSAAHQQRRGRGPECCRNAQKATQAGADCSPCSLTQPGSTDHQHRCRRPHNGRCR